MRCFITSSFGDSQENIEALCTIVREAGFEDFNFIRDVEKYQKIFTDPRELMARAREEIEKSQVLLIDMTDKPTGRAIEAGIAYSLGRKIIVIRRRGTAIKETSQGIADRLIEYDSIGDILASLKEAREEWTRNG